MRRRTVIKVTGGLGLQVALPVSLLHATPTSNLAGFLRERTSTRMLFPRPVDGAKVNINPVGLAWLPCSEAAGYRVEIRESGGRSVYAKNVGKDPVHLPDRTFPPGRYVWDVIGLSESGTDIARRGRQAYTVLAGAPELPWTPAKELLNRVPVGHPRVLYPVSNLGELRRTLTTTRAESWKACRVAADRAMRKGLPRFPEYHWIEDAGTRRLEYQKYFHDFRRYTWALMNLSLAFLFSEEEKYARAAKELLLHIAAWPTDDQDVTSVRAKWGDEVGLSFSRCAHLAYDWLYPALSTEERYAVLKMCEARAGQTYRRLVEHNYLTNPGESHDGRLIAYLSDMAIAMAGETDQAERWLDYSLKALTTVYPHWGGTDGGWAEGVPYGLWYNTFYIPAFQSLCDLAGYNLWQRPFFNNIRYFFFYCTANHGEIRPFGDSAEGGGPGVKRGSGFDRLMAFHAHTFNDPYVGWWVNQVPDREAGRSGFLGLVHEDEVPAREPSNLPNSRVFQDVGWAGLHSDLTQPDRDTCLVFKSSPYGSVSHSHADQNAFTIMKGGKALAIPSGYYGPSYGKPHHAEWTRSTKANNCILVDGEGQVMRSNIGGYIVDFKEADGHTYVVGDATAAYQDKLSKWIRRILFLRPGIFLLLDEIEAPIEANFQWMLHAFEKMEVGKDRIVSTRADANLEVTLACSEGFRFSQTDQFDTPYNEGIPETYQRDKPNHWHVMAETINPARNVRIAAVMAVENKLQPLRFENQREEGWLGVKADDGVSGWIRTVQEPLSLPGRKETVVLWGRDRDGAEFAV